MPRFSLFNILMDFFGLCIDYRGGVLILSACWLDGGESIRIRQDRLFSRGVRLLSTGFRLGPHHIPPFSFFAVKYLYFILNIDVKKPVFPGTHGHPSLQPIPTPAAYIRLKP
uniref:Uncharacterized protein n=1 Tax=Opuntia streptacantha TaxID=393608 RepID=A0A7C9EWI2_OPUST